MIHADLHSFRENDRLQLDWSCKLSNTYIAEQRVSSGFFLREYFKLFRETRLDIVHSE